MEKFHRVLSAVAVLLALAGCATDPLERSSPGKEGVDPAAVRSFAESLERKMMHSGDPADGSADAFMLLKNGKIIAEGAWAPYRMDARRHVYSMSKSFVSIAIGFAVQEKLLSIDDPVTGFFPDKLPEKVSENLAAMKIRDLLTMQSGHKPDPLGAMFEAGDMVGGFLAAEVAHRPGTLFVYNNGATYMLSAILSKVTGQPVKEYLTPRLFGPLGIENVEWEADKDGVNFGAWGLRLTPEEAAKFAQFCLNRGGWDGEQLLDGAWFDQASARQCELPFRKEKPDWNCGYGFQFWGCRNGAYRADGFLGQLAIMMPEENAALILFNSSNREQLSFDALWEELYPALRGKKTSGRTMTDAELSGFLKELTLEFPETAAEPVKFRPGARIEATLPEDNIFQLKELILEYPGDAIRTTFDGVSRDFGIGKWLDNPPVPKAENPHESYPVDGPLLCRAYRQGPDEWLLVTVSPESAVQNQLRVRVEDRTVILSGRFTFNDKFETVPAAIR